MQGGLGLTKTMLSGEKRKLAEDVEAASEEIQKLMCGFETLGQSNRELQVAFATCELHFIACARCSPRDL